MPKKVKKSIKKEKESKKKEKKEKEVKKTKRVKKAGEIKKETKKETIKKAVKKPKPISRPVRYYQAIGKRKTAIARIRLWTKGEKEFLINEKPYQEYFPTFELQQIASASLRKMKCLDRFRVLAKVKGGGIHAQAEAVRHGTARVLILFNPDFRKRLKKAGYLTRDPRMRERKKFGLKRARRAPQWQKR